MRVWNYIFLISILLFAAFIRFYRLADMASFDFDQEYAANFAYNVLRVYPIQLVGQGLSVPGLFMGPLYFYYLVPFFAVTGLYPIGGIIGSAIFSLIIIFTYFLVGKSLFGIKVGIIAAFIRSILINEIGNDLSMAPSYSSELLILITWLLFYKYWQGQTKYFPILGFVFGLYTSIHPILFPFYFVFLLLLLIKRRLPNLKNTIISILATIVPLVPLILFEYFHNFLEVKRLFEIFSKNPSETNHISDLLKYLSFILKEPQRVLSFGFIPENLFIFLFLGTILLLIIKKVGFWENTFHKTTLFVTFSVFIIYYTFFPTHVPEYYFQALTTMTILYLSACLTLLTKNHILNIFFLIILINIIFYNIQGLINKWNNPSPASLNQKNMIVKEILQRTPQNQEFYVSYISSPGWNFGFNYLFKYYNRIPQTKEAKPPIYTIVIPKSLSLESIDIVSGNIGLILPK